MKRKGSGRRNPKRKRRNGQKKTCRHILLITLVLVSERYVHDLRVHCDITPAGLPDYNIHLEALNWGQTITGSRRKWKK